MAPRSGSHASRGGPLRTLAPLVVLVVLLALVVALGIGVWRLVTGQKSVTVPPSEQCVATVGSTSSSLNLTQSRYAAIIVAESIRRGLPARAASIALATAMQESNLQNIPAGEGDLDSVGLFQQRPSQGWGTAAEIADPWYAAGAFYAALVKESNWQTAAIGTVAQEVQKSAVPDGYDKHVTNAKTWASAATGNSTAAISCVNRATTAGSASELATMLGKTFGTDHVQVSGQKVTVAGLSTTKQWAAAALSMMETGTVGTSQVSVNGKSWANDGTKLATWTSATPSTSVVVTVRG